MSTRAICARPCARDGTISWTWIRLALGPTWPRGARRVRWPNPRNRSEPRRDRPVVARSPRRLRGRPRASALRVDFRVVRETPLAPQDGVRDAALLRHDG